MKYSRNSISRFVPILLVIVITIVAVAAVIAIGRAIMNSGNDNTSNDTQSNISEARAALLASDVSRAVRLTVRGPIVANENFRSYRITISPDSRVMTTFEGYLDKQIDSKRLDNNLTAYEELIHALDKRRMMDGRTLTSEQNDLRGVCATGRVYQFETMVNGESLNSLWTSDCSGSKGSALANVSEILDMFLRQIPDGKKMARTVGLEQADTFFSL